MNFIKILNFLPGYQAWRSRTTPSGSGIDHALIEQNDENEIQSAWRSNASLADIRDFIRNTSFGQALLNQLMVNAVGTVGGRLSFATKDDAFNAAVNKNWARYARCCGFKGHESFNRILRDIVGCLFFNGGDALLVFDDGRLTGGKGTGKVLIFESDQIANAPKTYFAKNFPATWTQSRGMIFDQFKRPVGFFAGAKRGVNEFAVSSDGTPQFMTFVDHHPDQNPERCPFFFVARTWRPNQGRGTSAILHVIDDLRKLEEMQSAENDAACLNAHIGLAITEDSSASDALLADSIMNGEQPKPQKVKFDAMLRRRAAVLQLPKGKAVTSFDTKRPNDRVIDFIDAQKGLIAAAFGLGKQFYTLTPESSFTAHRGAMQMAWQTIRQVQGDLTDVCNWLASQWFYWMRTKQGLAVTDEILADIDFCTEWAWPEMPEVDSAKHESTKAASMQNGTKTYRDLIGPEWRRKVEERAVGRKFFAECGEVYPGDRMVTGGVVDAPHINEKEVETQTNGNE